MAASPPVADRLLALLRHLGIERAHLAAAMPNDWQGLAADHADRIASLSLAFPTAIDTAAAARLGVRLLLLHGDLGPIAERAWAAAARLPEAARLTLAGISGVLYADPAVTRRDEILPALLDFLARMERQRPAAAGVLAPGEGEVAGIAYRVAGSGPPLLLLPMGLAPSQWDPLLLGLGERFTIITLAGPHLGIMPPLEARGGTPGYLRMIRNVIDAVAPRPGETILEVGGGTGVMARFLAQSTAGGNPITAVDINRYLLREAAALAAKAGFGDAIAFRDGNAEALPFADESFDATLCFTVLEEGDADRMLTELVRVTRRGGRVGVIVRGEDIPAFLGLPLDPALRAKAVRAVAGSMVERGCADASLYRRCLAAGLADLRKLPQLAVYKTAANAMVAYYLSRVQSVLTGGDAEAWRTALAQAEAEGSFLLAVPHHCAVGTRPR